MIRRIAGVLLRPRATLVELVETRSWAATWLLILSIWGVCGWALLATAAGQQALVDERVRVVESFGGTVTDSEYADLLARPPWWVYFTSGGRLLLTPEVTLLVAVALWAIARFEGVPVRFDQGLTIAVHATMVLIVGQLIATPVHLVRESLTSPLTLASFLPVTEGSLSARFFGSLDLFALWWVALLAVGLSVLTRRRASRYAVAATALCVGFAAIVTAVTAVMDRS